MSHDAARDCPSRTSARCDKNPVTQDILIDQAAELEKFQWSVRAHLENAGGKLAHEGSSTERGAAKAPSVRADSRGMGQTASVGSARDRGGL